MTKFKYESLSYVGRRKNNQDSCFSGEINKGFYFLAVADGMGGAAGGEIASKTVISTAMEVLDNASQSEIDPDMLKVILNEIFEKSQEALALIIAQDVELTGMGTTLACALIYNNKYVWGNIGDSRIYLVTEKSISQLTKDHTYIQEHIDKHGDNIPENLYKTYGHIITRSLNGENDKLDIFPSNTNYSIINNGELLLLCSDGLISNKTDTDNSNFQEIIIGNIDLLKTAENLISYAYAKGSTDNITVVLGEFGDMKRKKISLPEFIYPPLEEERIEMLNDSPDPVPDDLENIVDIGDTYSYLDKRNPKNNILKILLVSIIILLMFSGVLYLYLQNSGENVSLRINVNNDVREENQEEIVEMEFEGFVSETEIFYLKNNPSIYWLRYKGRGFLRYIVSVDGEQYPINNKQTTYIDISTLGIKTEGTYNLNVLVKLKNGTTKNGNRDLTLTIK